MLARRRPGGNAEAQKLGPTPLGARQQEEAAHSERAPRPNLFGPRALSKALGPRSQPLPALVAGQSPSAHSISSVSRAWESAGLWRCSVRADTCVLEPSLQPLIAAPGHLGRI